MININRFDVTKENLRKIPAHPGIYVFFDRNHDILYIGKSKTLKNRVAQYFQSKSESDRKTSEMVPRIRSFGYILTDTELDALLLECQLINHYLPYFNRLLKGTSRFRFLEITTGEKFPLLQVSHTPTNAESIYFGPFNNTRHVEGIIHFLCTAVSLRTCKALPDRVSPCLKHTLNDCSAPCCGRISQSDYEKKIESILDFLKGDYSPLTSLIQSRMQEAAAGLVFEKAARYRDMLETLGPITHRLDMIRESSLFKIKIALLETADGRFKIFGLRGNRLLYSSIFESEKELPKELRDCRIFLQDLEFSSNSQEDLRNFFQANILHNYLKKNNLLNPPEE